MLYFFVCFTDLKAFLIVNNAHESLLIFKAKNSQVKMCGVERKKTILFEIIKQIDCNNTRNFAILALNSDIQMSTLERT
jgi:hypothetical protein